MRSRMHVSATRTLLGFALIVIPGGCTRDDTPAPTGQGSSELLATVQDLLQRARKGVAGKTASGELAELQKSIEKAKAASEQGKAEVAAKSLRIVRGRLNDLIAEQKKNIDAVKALVADKAAVEDARKKADAEQAAQHAPEFYGPAEESRRRANELAAKGTWTEAASAKQLYSSAVNQYDQATFVSKNNKVARDRAEGEKKAMLALKARAGTNGAEEHASLDWLHAARSERDADMQMKLGEFAQASETYRQATDQYQRALEGIQEEDGNEKVVRTPAKKAAPRIDSEPIQPRRSIEGDSEAPRPAVPEKKSSTAKKNDSRSAIEPGALQLPPDGYAERLRTVVSEEKESAGVRAKIAVVPDAYRYYMAVGFEELAKASYDNAELKKKLRELYAKHSKDKGKAIYFLSLSSKGGNDHHFTQTALKSHVLLRGTSRKNIGGFKEDPKPGFAVWQVFEQRADQRNVLKKNLSEFKSITAEFTSDQKAGDKDPLTLSVRELVHVTDRREEQKTDYRAFEGINVGLKQVSSSDWKSQIVPELQFKLYPGQWQIPDPPTGFDELLNSLEVNG